MLIYQCAETTPFHIQMMGYVFRADDGTLMVMDGGNYGDGPHLLQVLKHLSGSEKPHVAVWLMTHIHSDHVDAFRYLTENCPDAFNVGKVVHAFPGLGYVEAGEPGEAHTLREWNTLQPILSERCEVLRLSEGDVIEQSGIRFTVLQVPDEQPKSNVINNASTVFRMEYGSQSALFLGDLGVEGGQRLLAKHGSRLKSDIVEMAHHGQNGVEKAVYAAVSPEVCLWNAPIWLWQNDPGKGYGTGPWRTLEVREWIRSLGDARHVGIWEGDRSLWLKDGRILICPEKAV